MLQFTLCDLLLGILVALLYNVTFLVHKTIFPKHYFALGEYVSRPSFVRLSALLVRVFIILVFSTIAYLVFGNTFVVYFGVVFGCFINVWPAMVKPEPYLPGIKMRTLLVVGYSIYILCAVFTTHVALIPASYIRSMLFSVDWYNPSHAFSVIALFLPFPIWAVTKVFRVIERVEEQNIHLHDELINHEDAAQDMTNDE